MGIMRLSIMSAIALACTALAGCTSSSGIDNLMPQPSTDLTGSVIRPAEPVMDVARASQSLPPEPQQEVLAWAGPVPDAGPFKTTPPAPVVQPTEQRIITPVSMPKPEIAAYPPVRLAPEQRYRVYGQRFRDAKPINFGKASPRQHAVHGVDVSRWQGNIDWSTLRKNGANFAYIKATDGGDHLDPMFRKNWNAAKLLA